MNIAKFELNHSSILVNNKPKSVEDFGRHLKLSHQNSKKVRLYSIVLCQTDANINFRKELLDCYNRVVVEKVQAINKINYNEFSNTMPLFIKKYDQNGRFSKFVHETQSGQSGFSVAGPYGVGLELRKGSQGKHIIFAAGTGIFPFLDLLDYMLRKVIDAALTETVGKEAADAVNIHNEDYAGTFHPTFSITFNAACASPEEFVGLDIIRNLSEICKRHNKPWFDGSLKIPGHAKVGELEVSSNRFAAEVTSAVKQSGVTKVYICGPPQFSYEIPKTLVKAGLEAHKIVFV